MDVRLGRGAACRDLGWRRALIATIGLGRRGQWLAVRPLGCALLENGANMRQHHDHDEYRDRDQDDVDGKV